MAPVTAIRTDARDRLECHDQSGCEISSRWSRTESVRQPPSKTGGDQLCRVKSPTTWRGSQCS